MSTQKKNQIGTVLFFNQTIYETTCRAWQAVIDSINEVSEYYQSLGIGNFSKEILLDLYNHGIKNTSEKFHDVVNKQVENSGINLKVLRDAFTQNINDELAKFSDKLEKLKGVITRVQSYQLNGVLINLQDIEIVENKAAWTTGFKEKLKTDASIIITNEEQLTFYNQFLELKQKFDAFADNHINNSDLKKCDLFGTHNNVVFTLDDDNHLDMDPHTILNF